MSSKPAQVRYVTGGKSLGAAIHKGWAATWNWVLSWVCHFKAGKGCTISGAEKGYPRLDVLIDQGDGIEVTGGEDGKPYVISCTVSGNSGGGSSGGGSSGGGSSGGGGSNDELPDFSSGITGNKSVVAEIQYDASSHKLQAKFVAVTYSNGIVTGWAVDTNWTDVFEAEAHEAEVS